MDGIKILGIGKAVPKLTVTNDDISKLVDTSDNWITQRTGIKARHIATDETTTQLAVEAAREALGASGVIAGEIDLIIVATVSPDGTMPSTACNVAGELGITNATCFDITAACSGFIYASEVAVSMMRQGRYEKALVIGAEVLTKLINWQDRGTCVLFGDGAGAVVYAKGKEEENQVIKINTKSDGTKGEFLTMTYPTIDNTFYKLDAEQKGITMDGREVYKFATTMVPTNIQEILDEAQLEVSDVDWYIMHQANTRIIDVIAKKLKVDNEKFIKNLETNGNTSGSSIPIAMYDMKHLFKKGDKIMISGFGAGLTWGSMLITW